MAPAAAITSAITAALKIRTIRCLFRWVFRMAHQAVGFTLLVIEQALGTLVAVQAVGEFAARFVYQL